MAAKFDKEFMKKHHFWLLFAPIGLFVLIAWYGLLDEVPTDIQAAQEKHEAEKKKLAAGVKVLPRKVLDEYGKQIGKLDEQRDVLWKDGWNLQKDLFDWPAGYTDANQRAAVSDLKFGDDIPDRDVRDHFRTDNVYPAEYRNLVKSVEPMQFRDSWDKVLRYKAPWGNIPSSEDMWLAMEDFWVQREVLRALNQVNVDAATFKLIKDNPDKLHRIFESRFWRLEIELVDLKGKQTLKAKLKNISRRLQVMGVGNTMNLEVTLSGRPFTFEVQGDPIEADAEHDVKPLLRHTLPPDWKKVDSIDAVRQVFDARTVPVKRLEFMELGWVCDRFRNLKPQLKMAKFSEDLAKKELPPVPTGPTGESLAPTPPPGGEQAPPQEANYPPLSQNGLQRKRYIEATEQIRIFPLGFVVTTDQSFMKDIMEQLLKSRLRFQMTQTDYVRFHGALNYDPANNAGGPRPMGGGRPPVGGGEGGRPFAPAGGGANGPTNSREDQFSANLMELTIYGVVSMYERVPDAKPAGKTPKK